MQYPNRLRALVPASVLLLSGVLAARAGSLSPGGVRAVAYQPRIGTPGAFIQVSWSRPDHVPSSLILGSVIFRNDFASQFVVAGGRDGDTGHAFLDSEAARTVYAYNGTPASSAGTRTQFTVSGIVPGQQYSYQVATAYNSGVQNIGNAGTGTVNDQQYLSPLSNSTAYVTAIAPPGITAVNGAQTGGNVVQVNPQSVTLEWQQTPGADAYTIWASRDIAFRNHVVVAKRVSTVPVNLGGSATAATTVNISKSKLRSKSGVTYLTVGAWNTGDRQRPQPFGAIFSAPVVVTSETTPPPPPGG